MKDINVIVLTGRLVRDADLKSKNSYDVLEFTIASNYSVKRNDQWEDEANFIDCRISGKRATSLHQYLVKGKHVSIEGEIRHQRWTTESGDKKSRIVVLVDTLIMASSQKQNDQAKPQQQEQ